MSDVTVIAVRSFLFEGRSITKGEDVTLPAIHAAMEARKGNVSLSRVPKAQIKAMKAEVPQPVPVQATRGRRRRGAQVAPSSPDTSQQYRRRDMTAEDPT